MLEVEVKTPCPDPAAVERKLRRVGAKFLGEVEQRDLYLNHPCRDFPRTDEALRIRTAGDRMEITYKGRKIDRDTKTREEITCPVDNPEGLIDALIGLGFRKGGEVLKVRRRYELDGVEVAIDRVGGLGCFVELEARVDDLARGKGMISRTMERLGLRGSERRSYLEMLLEGRG